MQYYIKAIDSAYTILPSYVYWHNNK